MAMRNYTRWVERTFSALGNRILDADILGSEYSLWADEATGGVSLALHNPAGITLTPDEARMLGVRLIEGAALADGDRAVRRAPQA